MFLLVLKNVGITLFVHIFVQKYQTGPAIFF